MVEKDLTKGLQALPLKEDADKQNSADAQGTKPEVPSRAITKWKEGENETLMPAYEMIKQELQLQEEEEKYRVYTGTFSYKGDRFRYRL